MGENARVREPLPSGRGARQAGEGTHADTSELSAEVQRRVQAACCRFPLCHWRDISPGGGECACVREPLPSGRGGRQAGEGTHAVTSQLSTKCKTRSRCPRRFPLCHWRDISPGGGECACCANLSLQGEVPGRPEREPTRSRRSCLAVQDAFRLRSPVPPLSLAGHLPRWGRMRVCANLSLQGEVPGRAEREPTRSGRSCLAVLDTFTLRLPVPPLSLEVTSPPAVENAPIARTSPFRERWPAGR